MHSDTCSAIEHGFGVTRVIVGHGTPIGLKVQMLAGGQFEGRMP